MNMAWLIDKSAGPAVNFVAVFVDGPMGMPTHEEAEKLANKITSVMSDQIPRRVRLDQMTPEELAIYNLVGEIEALGAHPILTDVVNLLGRARGKLADWVDLQEAEAKSEAFAGVIRMVGNGPHNTTGK